MKQKDNPTEPTEFHRPAATLRKGIFLTIAFYFLFAAVAFSMIDHETLLKPLALPAATLILILCLSASNYVLRAWRWQIFGRALGIRSSLPRNIIYYVAGFSFTTTPGRLGEAVRLWFLKRSHQIPVFKSASMIIVDRLSDLWAILIMSAVASFWFTQHSWQVALIIAGVAVITVPLMKPSLLLSPLNYFGDKAGFIGKITCRLSETVEGLHNLNAAKILLFSLIPAVLGWIAEAYGFFILLRALDVAITLPEAIFIFSFSMLVGAISLLPGGLGGVEATSIFLLTTLDISLDMAVLATAIMRLLTLWFAVLLGLMALPIATRLSSKPEPPATEPSQ